MNGLRCMWKSAAIAAAVLLVTIVVGVCWAPWSGSGRFVAGIEGGRVECAWSDTAIAREHGGFLVKSPIHEAVFAQKYSPWRPRLVTFQLNRFLAGMPVTSTLTTVSVPLWPWTALLAMAAAVLWMLSPRRRDAKSCPSCGYDMSGIPRVQCPECGEQLSPESSSVAACIVSMFALLAISEPAAAQQPATQSRDITVRVVDQAGAPKAGVEVGSTVIGSGPGGARGAHLGFYGGKDHPKETSDKNGRVSIDPGWMFRGAEDTRPQTIIAWTPDRTEMGFLKIVPGDAGRVMELAIAPACRVTVKMSSKGLEALGKRLTWSNVYVFWEDMRPMSCDATNGVHELLLPAGEFVLHAYGKDTFTERPTLRIEKGERAKTVEIDLPPDRIAQLVGKPAPELAKIKGWKNGGPVTLESLRGKVVILDFWGYWCGPCVHSMPELMEIHDKYKDRGLVIIAIHDDSVASIAEMDSKLEKIRSEVWKDRDLPFVVALDGGGATPVAGGKFTARGATTAAYGISGFPTTLLIGRDGNVVGKINVRESGALERALRDK